MRRDKPLAKADMTPEQRECYELLCGLVCGEHHLTSPVYAWSGAGIRYAHYGELATFDFDKLTRLVVMAHDRCIRATVMASGPRMVGIGLSKRSREGCFAERHPTMEEAIARCRGVSS